MVIKPLRLKKKKRQWKKFLPLLLVVLMFSSVLIVFNYSAGSAQKMKIRVLVFNVISQNYETVYSRNLDFIEGTTALQLLYMTNLNIDYSNSTIECISSFCNLDQQWEFYVNDQWVLQAPENYVVKVNDDVLFVYR
jgi:predicted phosphoadenosine phosphosulfate sulfurtransferase